MSAHRYPLPAVEIAPSSLLDEDEPFGRQALRIGNYRVWFAYDGYTDPDALTVYVELGAAGALDVANTLNLLLGLCLEVEGAARGQVVRHPQTGRLVYRFSYALHDDHDTADLLDAISTLIARQDFAPDWDPYY